jgi:hypothetical protein
MNDTPRTNDIIEQIKGFRTSSAIYSLEQFSRTIECELTAARKELRIAKRDMSDGHAQWIMDCDIIQSLTEQRDKFKSIAETTINDHEMSEIRNHKLTEQRDEARRLAERYRNLSCDSQEEADETLLPWEATNQNEP